MHISRQDASILIARRSSAYFKRKMSRRLVFKLNQRVLPWAPTRMRRGGNGHQSSPREGEEQDSYPKKKGGPKDQRQSRKGSQESWEIREVQGLHSYLGKDFYCIVVTKSLQAGCLLCTTFIVKTVVDHITGPHRLCKGGFACAGVLFLWIPSVH